MRDTMVLTVQGVAQLLDCSEKTIEDRARVGELPGLKFGTGWIFPAGALFARLDELALEQARVRRAPPAPSAQLHSIPGKRARRTPPKLPAA